jgi:hypothetical protein
MGEGPRQHEGVETRMCKDCQVTEQQRHHSYHSTNRKKSSRNHAILRKAKLSMKVCEVFPSTPSILSRDIPAPILDYFAMPGPEKKTGSR